MAFLQNLLVSLCFILVFLSSSIDATYTEVNSWGSPGTGDGQFSSPEGVAIDSLGNIYITDTFNNRVQKFDSSGTFISVIVPSITNPIGIAIDSLDNIYVSSNITTVHKYDSSGTEIIVDDWPISVANASGVAVNSGNGMVYVSQRNPIEAISIYDSTTGAFFSSFGSPGAGNGQFTFLQGIALDPSGNVYAADEVNLRIQVFSSAGTYLSQFPTSIDPVGIGVSPTAVFVVNSNLGIPQVVKYTLTGSLLTSFGGLSDFTAPYGVAINPQGAVYVVDLLHTPSVTVWTQTTSAAQSTVVAAPLSVPADGTTLSTITVTIKDAAGDPISGHTVSLAQTGSSLISLPSGPSDINGVVTFQVVNNVAETVTYTATDTTDSVVITQTASVTFTGGSDTSATKSSVIASPTSVAANGISTSTITVTLISTDDLPVAGHVVSLAALNGSSVITPLSLPAGISNGSGVVTFSVTDITAETVVYQATDLTRPIVITQTASVTFSTGTVTDANVSTVTAAPLSALANGIATSTVTVTLKDNTGLPVPGHTVTLSTTSSSSISGPSGASDIFGVVTFTVTDTVVENAIYRARDTTDGVNIAQTATVQFTGGTIPDAVNSTVVASPTSVPADGVTTSTITVTVKDDSSPTPLPVVGATVTLAALNGSSVITTVSGTTNAAGQATFTVTDTTVETVTYQATAIVGEEPPVTIEQTADVSFTAVPPLPPSNFQGKIEREKCSLSEKFINILTWTPSLDPSVVGYRIYQNGVLVSDTPAAGPYKVAIPNRSDDKNYVYTLVSYNAEGIESTPLTRLFIKGQVFHP